MTDFLRFRGTSESHSSIPTGAEYCNSQRRTVADCINQQWDGDLKLLIKLRETRKRGSSVLFVIAREQIRHVITHTYSPVSAESVADDARTAPNTARKHLNTLADEGFVETTTGEHGGALYRRSPESLVVEQAANILDQVSTDELVTRIQDMREQLTEYQSVFGVAWPEELAVDQTNQALSESGSSLAEIDPETIREWKTLRRNLAFANAGLSIENAEQFVDGDGRSCEF